MNSETAQNPFPTSAEVTPPGLNGGGTVHRMAQKMHDAVDTLEQKIGTGSERMMGWQQEYGDSTREQIRANPLAAVGIAFAVGFLLAKITR